MTNLKAIKICYIWTIVFIIGLFIFGPKEPAVRAAIGMTATLAIIWIGLFGTTMYLLRKPIQKIATRFPMKKGLLFVLFATALALIEEAIAVLMTNSAPLYGVPVGEVMFTASTNYLEVIATHSVVVFIPMFICWAWLLKRYEFKPEQVFIFFGISGMLAEATINGAFALISGGYWILVYGFMIYLPAYAISWKKERKKPTWWTCVLAVILPLICATVVALVVQIITG